jgi:hypothetical protein
MADMNLTERSKVRPHKAKTQQHVQLFIGTMHAAFKFLLGAAWPGAVNRNCRTGAHCHDAAGGTAGARNFSGKCGDWDHWL